MANEVEIKFAIHDLTGVRKRLKDAGFHEVTPRTHEMNTLYDTALGTLRRRGEVLRIRKYGNEWKLTHKAKGKAGRHKTRKETETAVADGNKLEQVFVALGLKPAFRYEKFRSEWTDGSGHVVLDETPIGNFGEIEGPPHWIDRVAKALAISPEQYITDSYAELFYAWKPRMKSRAHDMTFAACKENRR
jgi:adenylate cyclase, class 2